MRRQLPWAAVVALTAAGPAHAQSATWYYSELDQDGNLELSAVEFDPVPSELFLAWDADESGIIDEEEFYTGLFDIWDRDADEALTREELAEGWPLWFEEDIETEYYEALDLTDDDLLTRDEVVPGLEETGAYDDWTAGEDLTNALLAERMFDLYDRDDDFALSEEEFAPLEGLTAPEPGTLDTGNIIALSEWSYDDLYAGGASAEDFIDEMEVYGLEDADAATLEDIGDVEDVLVGADGRILSVIAEVGGVWDIGDTHVSVPWTAVELSPSGDGIIVPINEDNLEEWGLFEESWATAGRLVDEPVSDLEDGALGPRVWRVTELIGDYARLRGDQGAIEYGYINDVILKSGVVAAVVVSPDMSGYGSGYRAYPYYGYDAAWGWDPGAEYYDLPYRGEDIGGLGEFDYDLLGR